MNAISVVRRWSAFPLRSLPLLVAVVALPCIYRPPELQQARKQVEAIAAIQKLGGRVHYGCSGSLGDDGASKDELFARVTEVDLQTLQDGDSDLQLLEGLPQLHVLILDYSNITNKGLKHITRSAPAPGVVAAAHKGWRRGVGTSCEIDSTPVAESRRHPDF